MAQLWFSYGVRISLPSIFYVVIGLSLVFTLCVLNETSRSPPRLWLRRSTTTAVTYSTVDYEQQQQEHVIAIEPQIKHRRIIVKVERYRERLRKLRSPAFVSSTNSANGRWKLLPGNVVVHDGDVDNPHDYQYILNPTDFCLGLMDHGQTRLLIFIESDSKNVHRRQVIRETWALPILQKAFNVRVVFLLGVSRRGELADDLTKEFYEYGDIVQENFTEGFKYLGLKSVMGLKWAVNFCLDAEFVVKTDDDILIHIPNLINALSQHRNTSKLLLCHKNKSRMIVRREPYLLKYQVSVGELPGAYFPLYCAGFAYVMSRDTAVALYEASLRTPYFFIEDVYVTGFCRHKAGIEAVDHPDIVLKPHLTVDQAPCSFAEGRITTQELDVQQMVAMWKSVNTRGLFCPVPIGLIS